MSLIKFIVVIVYMSVLASCGSSNDEQNIDITVDTIGRINIENIERAKDHLRRNYGDEKHIEAVVHDDSATTNISISSIVTRDNVKHVIIQDIVTTETLRNEIDECNKTIALLNKHKHENFSGQYSVSDIDDLILACRRRSFLGNFGMGIQEKDAISLANIYISHGITADDIMIHDIKKRIRILESHYNVLEAHSHE